MKNDSVFLKLFILVFLLFNLSCSQSPRIKSFQPWSQELQDREPYQHPYVSVFSDSKKKLIFVAIEHTQSLDNPTFKTIKKAFADFAFDAVVLEVGKFSEGVNPERVIRLFPECVKEKFTSQCGESYYSALLAHEKEVDFYFAEPDDEKIYQELRKHNYSSEDFLFYYLARNIPQWKMQGLLQKEKFATQASHFISRYLSFTDLSKEPSVEEFEVWLKNTAKLNKSIFEIEYGDIGPSKGHPTFLHEITEKISRVREAFIIDAINKVFQKHDRILVVYGSFHLTKQRPYWESLLGPSKNYKYF